MSGTKDQHLLNNQERLAELVNKLDRMGHHDIAERLIEILHDKIAAKEEE